MRGIKIPQYEFALQKRGGGGVFAGHYGKLHDLYQQLNCSNNANAQFHLGK